MVNVRARCPRTVTSAGRAVSTHTVAVVVPAYRSRGPTRRSRPDAATDMTHDRRARDVDAGNCRYGWTAGDEPDLASDAATSVAVFNGAPKLRKRPPKAIAFSESTFVVLR